MKPRPSQPREAQPAAKAVQERPRNTPRPETNKAAVENRAQPAARSDRSANRPPRSDRRMSSQRQDRWQNRIQAEETIEDIIRDNERIEKEIWLEIASFHTIKLDF